MKRLIGLMLSLVLLTGILAGCANTATGGNGTALDDSSAISQTGASDAEEAWPRTITNALGKQTTPEKKPERVALLDFGYIKTLLALDITPVASALAERSINSFGTLQLYAAKAQIEELRENKASNLKKLVELEPDLIPYTAEKRNLDMTFYEAASRITPVVTFNIPDWKEQLRVFAKCLGEGEKAEACIPETEVLIAEPRKKLTGYSDKTVTILFERSSDVGNFLVLASDNYPVWSDKESSLRLTTPDGYIKTGQEMIPLEGISALNPDYIFLLGSLETQADGYKQIYLSEGTRVSSVWQSLNAIKDGRVYYLGAAVQAADPLNIRFGMESIMESMTE